MLEINRHISLISLTKKPTKVNTRGTLKRERGSSSSETFSHVIPHQQFATNSNNNKKTEM